MNAVKVQPKHQSYLNDERLDLEKLGFTKEERRESHNEVLVYYTLELGNASRIEIGASLYYGEIESTTTELVINDQAEVVDIRNIYDLYILIAIHKPHKNTVDMDIMDMLSAWGTVLEFHDEPDGNLYITYKNFASEIGASNHFILFIRQMFPEHKYIKEMHLTFGHALGLHISKGPVYEA